MNTRYPKVDNVFSDDPLRQADNVRYEASRLDHQYGRIVLTFPNSPLSPSWLEKVPPCLPDTAANRAKMAGLSLIHSRRMRNTAETVQAVVEHAEASSLPRNGPYSPRDPRTWEPTNFLLRSKVARLKKDQPPWRPASIQTLEVLLSETAFQPLGKQSRDIMSSIRSSVLRRYAHSTASRGGH